MEDIGLSGDPFEGSEITTILVVSDMERSEEFYVGKLGAEIYRKYGGDSLVLKFLNHWILLVTSGPPTSDKPKTSFEPPNGRQSVSHSFTIRVQDCNTSYQSLRQRGVDFITPPVTRGQEIRGFFFDPDGHLFEISEYTP